MPLSAELREAFDRLGPGEGYGYLFWPLPDPYDAYPELIVDSYLGSDGRGQAEIRDALQIDQCQALEVYAERMATEAVRQQSAEPVLRGLVALGLASVREYEKELILRLPLLWRSAEHVGVDPGALFAVATRYLDPIAPDWLALYPQRSTEDRTLATMGYYELDDPPVDGLRYERPGYGEARAQVRAGR